jgi:hypothetical protein
MNKYLDIDSSLPIFITINTIIFLLLSLLHFYWAFGGQLWFHEVLPTNASGSMKLNPGRTSGVIIGTGLLFLALITIGNQGLFNHLINEKYFHYGALVIAIIFLLRAIGDFKFIGFFKSIKGTKFAINDTHFFSPLCLFIAVISLVIFIITRSKM